MKNFLSKSYYLFYCLVLVAFYLLIRQYIPFIDDIRYSYCYNDWPEPINSLTDIFKSQAYHYTHVNGRFLAHCVIQLFCGFRWQTAYFVISSFVFVILLISAISLIKQDLPDEAKQLHSLRYLFLFFLILFVPQIGLTFFGSVSFSVNYMWSTMISLTFLCVYYRIKKITEPLNKWQYVLLFIFGVICGSWQEAFSIPLAGALLIYHVVDLCKYRNLKDQLSLFFLVLGYGIGAIILIFTPANFARAAVESTTMRWYDIIQMLKHRSFFQSLIIITPLSLIIDIKKKQPLFILRNILYYIAICISFLFGILIAYHDLYQLTISEVFSVILTCKFIYEYLPSKWLVKSNVFISAIFLLVIIYTYITAYSLRSKMCEGYNQAVSSVLTTTDRIVYATMLEQINYEANSYPYIVTNCLNSVYFSTLYESPGLVSLYYTKSLNSVYDDIFPDDIQTMINACIDDNKLAENIYAPKQWYKLVVIDSSLSDTLYALVESAVADGVVTKIKDKIMRRKDKCYETKLANMRHFERDGKTYYIIPTHSFKGRKVDKQWIEEY